MPLRLAALAALTLAAVTRPALAADKPLEFHLTFDKAAHAKPFTGRVYVMLLKTRADELRSGPSWFRPEPFFAVDVKGWKPGEKLVVGADAVAHPIPLS